MIGQKTTEHCLSCGEVTVHEQGIFKCREIGDELFWLDISLDDALKGMSEGFRDYVLEQGGVMDGGSVDEFAQTPGAGLDFEILFAPSVRSRKCEECGHLIRLKRLP